MGLAAGNVDVMPMLRDWDFDALVTHNRFTLTNRNAELTMTFANSKRIAVLNAALTQAGCSPKARILTSDMYQEASEDALDPIREIEQICDTHGIPAGSAALQVFDAPRARTSTICGVTRPERVQQTLDSATCPIQGEVWRELLALPFDRDDPEATPEYKPG